MSLCVGVLSAVGTSVNFPVGEAEVAVVAVEPTYRQTCPGCSVHCSSGALPTTRPAPLNPVTETPPS